MASGQPVTVQHSRAAQFGHIVAMLGFVVGPSALIAVRFRTDSVLVPLLPLSIYLLYAVGSRILIPRHHRRAMRAFAHGDFEAAIAAMEASYAFFQRHEWLDRFRYVTVLSSSAISFREAALLGIAVSLVQLGRRDEAKAAYQRVVAEFPESIIGSRALKSIETFESPAPV